MAMSEDAVKLALKVNDELEALERIKNRALHNHGLAQVVLGESSMVASMLECHDDLLAACERLENLVKGDPGNNGS